MVGMSKKNKIDTRHTVAQNLRRLRLARGWTQTQLQERSGVIVGMIESGRRWPQHKTILALVEALGCEMSELFSNAALEAARDDEPANPVT